MSGFLGSAIGGIVGRIGSAFVKGLFGWFTDRQRRRDAIRQGELERQAEQDKQAAAILERERDAAAHRPDPSRPGDVLDRF